MMDLWLPPKPAIIRPHIEKASFLPGMFPASAAAARSIIYPQVRATNKGSTSALGGAANNYNVPLPSDVTAGRLLIIFINNSDTAPPETLTTPSGWTSLFTGASDNGRLSCFYKVAAGSEGSSVNVATSSAVTTSWVTISYSISDYQGVPVAATVSAGTTAANPPSLTPPWGSAMTLWLVIEAINAGGASSNVITPPTNYTGSILSSATAFSLHAGWLLGSAQRELIASSEDPGAFTNPVATTFTRCTTIAIRPA